MNLMESPTQEIPLTEQPNKKSVQKSIKPQTPKVSLTVMAVLTAVSLMIAGYFGYQNFQLRQQISLSKSSANPSASATPGPVATKPLPTDPTINWETYTLSNLGIKIRTPKYYGEPTQEYDQFVQNLINNTGSIFISNQNHFDSNNLFLCNDDFSNKPCLIPGERQFQAQDIYPMKLGGISSISFFVNNKESGDVIHVVQTTTNPKVEIAMDIGGALLENTFQQILSTFEFLE